MLKKIISILVSFSVLLSNASYAAQPEPLPMNHIWRGLMACTDGPRPFGLATIGLTPTPVIIILVGAKYSEPHTADYNGIMLAKSLPDPDAITLVTTRILAPAKDMPMKFLARIDPPTRKFYGGVSPTTGCDYVEAIQINDEHTEAIIRIGLRDPDAVINAYMETFHPEPHRHMPTPGELLALGLFAGAAMGAIPGAMAPAARPGANGRSDEMERQQIHQGW
jgi:hypothetical protein